MPSLAVPSTAQQGATQSEAAYWALRDEILEGLIGPGERLVEIPLAERLGMSRTPVREAIGRLVAEGLAKRLDGGGVVAATESVEEVLDTLRIFEVLQGLAARLAVERAGPHQIELLRARVTDMKAAISLADNTKVLTTSMAVNRQLWETAACPRLEAMLRTVAVSPQRQQHSTLWRPGRAEEAVAQYDGIVDAVEARDGDLAEIRARHMVARHREVRRVIESEVAERRRRGEHT